MRVQIADLGPGCGAAGITELRASVRLGVSGVLRGSTKLRITIDLVTVVLGDTVGLGDSTGLV